jgi:type I restriction enzyme S subunit
VSEVQELPQGWVWTRIGDIAETTSGGTPSRNHSEYYGGSIAWVKSGELKDDILRQVEEFLSEEGLKHSSAKIFHRDTVLIAMYGATVGKTGILGLNATTNQAICAILPREVIFTPKFLAYWLQSQRKKLIDLSFGGAQPNINQGIIRAFPLPLAPLPEQQRIVATLEQQLSRLDAGIAALRSTQKKLKRYRASVLKAAVQGKLTEVWRKSHPEVEPAPELLKRILQERRAKWEEGQIAKGRDPQKVKYEEPAGPDVKGLPELPERWCWVAFEQVANFQNGRPFPSKEYIKEGYKLLRPGNLFADGSVKWTESNTRYMSDLWAERNLDLIVRSSELVINLTAQSLKDEFLGRVCITSEGERCLLNQRLARIKPSEELSKLYILYLLKSAIFRRFVDGLNTGSLIQHMFTSQLTYFCLPLPPLSEQEQIVSLVEERLSIVSTLESTIEQVLKRAERMRQSILHKAFTGKLVAQDPNDEPASALLERIRREREAATTPQKLKHLVYKENGKSSRKRVAESTQPYLLVDVRDPEPVDVQATTQGGLWD